MTRKRMVLAAIFAMGFAVVAFFGVRSLESQEATAQQTQNFWNAGSVEEATQVTGYEIASPAFLPEGFKLASKVMVSGIGTDIGAHRIVQRVWTQGEDRSVYMLLMQSPKFFELGNSEPSEMGGKPVQRSFAQGTDEAPAKLTLAWEQDGMFFALTGVLGPSVSEETLQTVAASVSMP